ncbi:free methionine-(R)-sulfoxide reductase [Liquorilactobacillus sucicola DSM 21376 = JCM 15457]|uniref:Gaf domain-containing protein n=1 Tax=Liquorilactobacillus sucicola DSM 21376 = JCM 15457 TaxID=1423806 RepID=A0A023CW05_9LACO|nr:GAF domain-containing protein [Liquorilactobacillus sucicola]KRN06162.1 gaf domain-containing protein [Liquorilactobacillus sucicola DSM 21376 = JCM 15457]GAJ26088.1 free methionine-(R)-sulfoxide reductase [Liquorilactobacillus sucicola DSM 21376 = JCM 15457]
MAKSLLSQQLDALLTAENNLIANLSNASALLFESLHDINWAGFYLYDESKKELVLGPFQGKVACMHIEIGKGVCGMAFSSQKVQRVRNVHDFPGHIACDAASMSELVIPLTKGERKLGVLDIDSPSVARFTREDELVIQEFAEVLLKHFPI